MNDEDRAKLRAFGLTEEKFKVMAHDLELEQLQEMVRDLEKFYAKFDSVMKQSDKAAGEKARNEFWLLEFRDLLKDVEAILKKFGPESRPGLKLVVLMKAVISLKVAELSMTL